MSPEPRHWSVIANSVLRTDLSCYDGIIVTHGTDTLAYAASALGFTLSGVPIPIVMVSSDKPLEDSESNGLINFSNAVSFITGAGLPGVYVVYRNHDGRNVLHLGTRLTSPFPFNNSFRSEKDAFVGEFKNGDFSFNRNPLSVTADELREPLPPIHLLLSFCEDVLYIRPYPGLNYDYMDLSAHPKAVLHDLYHCGTACTETDDERFSVIRFASRCSELNVPFYVAPISGEGDIYETCRDLLDVGVIAIHDIVEAALVKVMLAHGNEGSIPNVRHFITEVDVAYEFIRCKMPNKAMDGNEE